MRIFFFRNGDRSIFFKKVESMSLRLNEVKNTAPDNSEKIWRVLIIFEIKLRIDFLDQ